MTVLDTFRLDGRVAIVTGGSSRRGAALAMGLAEAGADIVLAARRPDRLESVAGTLRDMGRRALPVATDVADPRQCSALVDAALTEFGSVDILVNNAGSGSVGSALREPPDLFRSVVDVNLHGSYWAAQACGRVMRPGSSIVNISSILGMTTAGAPLASYSASKAAIIGLTRDLAQQWGSRKGIRVNAIAPGFFPLEPTADGHDGNFDWPIDRVVLGRIGHPSELAATVVWLASEAGGYVTGQTIVVDGGVTIT